jgi:hypothetical protein
MEQETRMNNIYDFHQPFDFTQLFLTTPVLSNGGNYFIKFVLSGDNPLYIQPPKCTTKQGLVKTNGGKKHHCDLVFSNANEELIKWIEDLEKYSQEYIFKNRERWFESQLEMEDIDNFFSPSLKIYKSGKSYLLRTTIPTRLGNCTLKIFDENENEFNNEDLKETTNIITILEIKGIKCSSKCFQIDIEIKQMMVLKPSLLFEKCIIKKIKEPMDNDDEPRENTTVSSFNGIIAPTDGNNISENEELRIGDNIEEINLSLSNISNDPQQPIILKDRKEMFHKIYKEAFKKAVDARNLAINLYLEAKEIKNIYKLEELEGDDNEDIEEEFFKFTKNNG